MYLLFLNWCGEWFHCLRGFSFFFFSLATASKPRSQHGWTHLADGLTPIKFIGVEVDMNTTWTTGQVEVCHTVSWQDPFHTIEFPNHLFRRWQCTEYMPLPRYMSPGIPEGLTLSLVYVRINGASYETGALPHTSTQQQQILGQAQRSSWLRVEESWRRQESEYQTAYWCHHWGENIILKVSMVKDRARVLILQQL